MSLALATKVVTDFKGVRDLYVSLYGLLHRAPKQVLEFLAWVYFYPIDKDIPTEMKPMDALMSQAPGPQLQKWPLIHGRSGRRHGTSREPRTRELDSCPWNDSGLWSYIESDHGEDTRAPDESPTDVGIATNHQSQAPEPYRDRDTTTTVKVADALSPWTAPTDADPTRDAITLRHGLSVRAILHNELRATTKRIPRRLHPPPFNARPNRSMQRRGLRP